MSVRNACCALALLLPCAASALEHRLNGVGMVFVKVPAGSFTMGTPDLADVQFESAVADPETIADEQPAHPVRITRAFWLGRTEVTQGQWLRVMGTRPGPDEHWRRPEWASLPVVSVNWDEAVAFAERLGRLDAPNRYRLPTEAEWEYAARAGTTGLRPFPLEELGDHAWFVGNSGDVPQPVATRKPNAFGLYDMFGNAWEWVADRYAPDGYARSPAADPPGPDYGNKRVRRGGSYHCAPHRVRAAYRAADRASQAYSVLGFRLVLEAPDRP